MEKLLSTIERKTKWNGIPDLSLYIVIGQMIMLVAYQAEHKIFEWTYLFPGAVWQGEVWRLVTFILIPPGSPSLLWGAIWCYLFYLYGHSLEQTWGQFRFSAYVLVGYLFTILTALLVPGIYLVPSHFFLSSVFLAFAQLNPNFELLLFFILPVKVKWLALLLWINYAMIFFGGSYTAKFIVVAGVANFLLFFGDSVFKSLRRISWQRKVQSPATSSGYTHKCTICGITDKDDPEIEFRYCTKCKGGPCFCMKHLKEHAAMHKPS